MEYDVVGHPYNTHLPVLNALDPAPTRVLEFGAGFYSTAAFLDMPTVERLVSIEIYDDWSEHVEERFGGDPRWTLLGADDEVPDFGDFDLIFVDDGRNEEERLRSIVYVLDRPHPRVVIHDAEFGPFINAIRGHANGAEVHVDTALTPYTAVVEATTEE